MNAKTLRAIREGFDGTALRAEPMSRHTTYRVGGAAELLAQPRNPEAAAWLSGFARRRNIPMTIIGAGSNVIAPDEGISGIVLAMIQTNGRVSFTNDRRARADAGVPLQDLVDAAAARGCGGLEALAGVPGTVGGAAVMNAGTRNADTASRVASVDAIDPAGKRRILFGADLSFGYRHSVFQDPGWLVLGVEFGLDAADPDDIRTRIASFIADRREKYPMDLPSAGSVFRRPPGDYPGRLIEEAGCKGMREGGAVVSERHANFIVNAGNATASDIVALIERIRERVLEKTGVHLELEQIIL